MKLPMLALIVAMAMATPLLPATAQAQTCAAEEFEGARYIVCTVDPAREQLRLFWRNAGGQPYRSFSALAQSLGESGKTLRFAMNAGMYTADFAPLGLYVEDGRELVHANTRAPDHSSGPIPNFYKKPNGVFYLTADGAGVVPTEDFLANERKVVFATQSGPLLVAEGKLHPALIEGSTDRTRRSGVGVCEGGSVRFAASEGRVNFHEFARFFRDGLGCPNALFLDGGRGVGLYEPELGRNDFSWHGGYGPMFAVVQ